MQGIGGADLGILSAVEQLEELDHELDVTNAAVPGLDLEFGPTRRHRALFDSPLEGLDFRDLGRAQVAAIDERSDRLQERAAQVEVAGDRPALDQGLPLPGASTRHVVAQSGVQRACQCALFAVGPQPHVDPVGDAHRRVLGQQADDLGSHPPEELGIGDDPGTEGLTLLIVEEYEVDVGAVVELGAAELAQSQHDEPSGRSVLPAGRAEPLLGPGPSQPGGGLGAGVGQVGEVDRDHLEWKPADDVVVADPECLAMAESADGERLLAFGRALPQAHPRGPR